jgi:hypothetical protein
MPFGARVVKIGLGMRFSAARYSLLKLTVPPVLLLEILDDVLLAAIHPSGEKQHQKLKLQCVHRVERTRVRGS